MCRKLGGCTNGICRLFNGINVKNITAAQDCGGSLIDPFHILPGSSLMWARGASKVLCSYFSDLPMLWHFGPLLGVLTDEAILVCE